MPDAQPRRSTRHGRGWLVTGPACLAVVLGGGVGSMTPAVGNVSAIVHVFDQSMAATVESPGSEPDPIVANEIEWLTSILLNPANDREVRKGAAERLLAMDIPEAMPPLAEALASGESSLMLAVIEAVERARQVDPALLEIAAEALRTVPDQALDPLALALARHNDRAFSRVAALATDAELDDAHRLGAIYALGAFRSRAAAVVLMSILDRAEDESGEIIDAVCDSLRRGTGLPYGADPEPWRQWWAEAGDQPREQWLTNLVQRLSDQLARAEQQIQQERDRGAAIQERIIEVYRELFPRLTVEEQVNTLPDLLDDPVPAVRVFALDRVARLLRDSVRIPEDVQQGMILRLDDDRAAIRLQAVRLLDQLNDDNTPTHFATRLTSEQNADVVGALLEALARRPSANTLEVLVPWLAEPAQSKRAANAIWQLTQSAAHDEQQFAADELIGALESVDDWKQSSAHVRLFAYAVPKDEPAAIDELLDANSEQVRIAAAEGLVARGWTEPVLERSWDSAMVPIVLRVLAESEPTLSTLRRLASLETEVARNDSPGNDALNGEWQDAVRELAGAFPIEQLLEVDDVLSEVPKGTRTLRTDVLSRAMEANDSLEQERRVAILTRLALLRLELDEPGAAFAAMDRVPDDALVSEARRVKFEAAVRSGRYDAAFSLNDDLDVWLALLDRLTDQSPDKAIALRDEMLQRFEGELTGDRKAELDAITDRLPTSGRLTDEESPT